MSVFHRHQEKIEDIIGKGPIWEEMRKPQIMHIPHKDYGLKKLTKRLKDSENYSSVKRIK